MLNSLFEFQQNVAVKRTVDFLDDAVQGKKFIVALAAVVSCRDFFADRFEAALGFAVFISGNGLLKLRIFVFLVQLAFEFGQKTGMREKRNRDVSIVDVRPEQRQIVLVFEIGKRCQDFGCRVFSREVFHAVVIGNPELVDPTNLAQRLG